MSGKRAKSGKEKLRNLCFRDDWKCWICEGHVPTDFAEGSPSAPSRDHVVPRSLFKKTKKSHSFFKANIRLAHRYCNSHRQSRAVKSEEAPLYAAGLQEAQEKWDLEHGTLV